MTEFFVGMRVVDLISNNVGSILAIVPARLVRETAGFTDAHERAYRLRLDGPADYLQRLGFEDHPAEIAIRERRNCVWALIEEIEPLPPLFQLAEAGDAEDGN